MGYSNSLNKRASLFIQPTFLSSTIIKLIIESYINSNQFLYFVKISLVRSIGVLYTSLGKKKELSGGDVFMISLAVADLLASLFVPILAVQDFVSNLRWHLGSLMCRLLPSVPSICLVASSWSLVLIAADRYRYY